MIIAYFKKKREEKMNKIRRKYDEFQKDRYNANFHWILERLSDELNKHTKNGESFDSIEFVRPIEIVNNDIEGTFEQAAKDIGLVYKPDDNSRSYSYCMCQVFSVPLPEKGKPKSIAQMMICENK